MSATPGGVPHAPVPTPINNHVEQTASRIVPSKDEKVLFDNITFDEINALTDVKKLHRKTNVTSVDALAKLVKGSLQGEVVDAIVATLVIAGSEDASPAFARVALDVLLGLSRSDRFAIVGMMLSKRTKSGVAAVCDMCKAPGDVVDVGAVKKAYKV